MSCNSLIISHPPLRTKPGFKAYRWAPSCFQRWDGDAAQATPGGLATQLELMKEVLDPTATGDDLLAEALLRTGYPLTERITTLTLAGKTVFSVADGALLLCLERALSHEVILAMADLKPAKSSCSTPVSPATTRSRKTPSSSSAPPAWRNSARSDFANSDHEKREPHEIRRPPPFVGFRVFCVFRG